MGSASESRPAAGIHEIAAWEPHRYQTVRDLIGPCLGTLDVSERTRTAYARNLSYYAEWLNAENRTGGQRDDFIAYKKHLMDTYESSTVSAYMTPVRILYQWASSEGLTRDITIGIRGPRASRGFRKDPLSVEQARQLLQIGEADAEALRDRALITLLIHTGIRTIEAIRADVGDVCTMAGHAVLRVWGKGRDEKDEFVILTADVLQSLNVYIQSRGQVNADDPLFSSESNRNRGGRLTTRSVSRIIKQALGDAGIRSDRITAHSLRHTAVTLALMAGATVQEAQAMARHANINTTMIYAHNLDRFGNSAESRIDQILRG